MSNKIIIQNSHSNKYKSGQRPTTALKFLAQNQNKCMTPLENAKSNIYSKNKSMHKVSNTIVNNKFKPSIKRSNIFNKARGNNSSQIKVSNIANDRSR